MYLSPGTLLQDRYRIDKALGHGGFGVTYVAEDLTLKVPVAVKEYLPLQLATRMAGYTRISVYGGEARDRFDYGLKRFLDEARAVAKFAHHPNIVSVRDYFEANGTAYLVMEYVEGITFHQFLHQQGGKISPAQAKGILLPIISALQEVHQAGLLHRDISPDNIYLTKSGPVKLLDFGAARYYMGEHSQSLSIILKTGFAPEEQYRPSGRQGAWTDVYALAATFYRAITGVTPPDALDRREGDTLVPPSRLGVALSPEEEKALLKGLAVQAAQRFQNVAEFRQALTARDDVPATGVTAPPPAEITTATPEPVPQEPPPSPPSAEIAPEVPVPPSPRASQRSMLLASLLTAGVLLLGVGGLLWWHFQGSSSGVGQAPVPATQGQMAVSSQTDAQSQEAAAPARGSSSGEKPAGAPGSPASPGQTPAAAPPAASAEALLAEGRTLYQEKRYGEAIEKLEEAVRLDPALAEAHYCLGLAYHQSLRYMEAVQAFQKALAAKADYAEASAGLGTAYYQLDQTQEAIQALEKAVNLDGKLTEARYYLGLAYLADGKQEEALKQYQALETADPEKARLLNEQLQQQAAVPETPPERAKQPEIVPPVKAPAPLAQPPAKTPPPPVQPPAATPSAGSPLWPWTSERLATEADLASLSFQELRLMRNEILARHGWVFRTRDLREYFQQQPWYRPRGSQQDLVRINRAIMAGLSPTERQNNAIILRHEMRRRQRQR